MLSVPLSAAKRGWLRWVAGMLALWVAPAAHAQLQQDTDPNPPDVISPSVTAVPIISAGLAYNTFIRTGCQTCIRWFRR
jgi:hypothetical protein